MTILETIVATYPEVNVADLYHTNGIKLQDDLDGLGVYIAEWAYTKPLPAGLKLGK